MSYFLKIFKLINWNLSTGIIRVAIKISLQIFFNKYWVPNIMLCTKVTSEKNIGEVQAFIELAFWSRRKKIKIKQTEL